MEAEAHSTDAFLKSLNLPNIPSTLTLSKTIPVTSGNIPVLSTPISRTSPEILNTHKTPINISSKYPLEISRPAVTDTSHTNRFPLIKPVLPTPTFPAESGVSINQVRFVFNVSPIILV